MHPLKVIKLILSTILAIPIIIHSLPYFQRPTRTPTKQTLSNGIQYDRIIWQQPRPVVLHLATIDLTQSNLGILVSPSSPGPNNTAIKAMTTSEFLTHYQLQLAVNASFFYKFQEDSPWAYYPKSGDPVNVVGQTISSGKFYPNTASKLDWPIICFDRRNQVQILPNPTCPKGIQQAVSGNEILLFDGKPLSTKQAIDGDKPYARTVLAHDKLGKKLWIIVVDGKQPSYSEGVKLAELIPLLQSLGADRAINLDGGGSTTMVAATSEGPKPLNAPIQNKIPMNQRPIANHIGFFTK